VAFSAVFGFLVLASVAVLLGLRVCFSCFLPFILFVEENGRFKFSEMQFCQTTLKGEQLFLNSLPNNSKR
jgi:hypothetical protein